VGVDNSGCFDLSASADWGVRGELFSFFCWAIATVLIAITIIIRRIDILIFIGA